MKKLFSASEDQYGSKDSVRARLAQGQSRGIMLARKATTHHNVHY